MPVVHFTGNIQRHVRCPQIEVSGQTIAEVLGEYFGRVPGAKSYVLDDQGAVRKHMLILVDGLSIRDRQRLSDPVELNSEVHVFQALSGG